jgi:hypothetical protein
MKRIFEKVISVEGVFVMAVILIAALTLGGVWSHIENKKFRSNVRPASRVTATAAEPNIMVSGIESIELEGGVTCYIIHEGRSSGISCIEKNEDK